MPPIAVETTLEKIEDLQCPIWIHFHKLMTLLGKLLAMQLTQEDIESESIRLRIRGRMTRRKLEMIQRQQWEGRDQRQDMPDNYIWILQELQERQRNYGVWLNLLRPVFQELPDDPTAREESRDVSCSYRDDIRCWIVEGLTCGALETRRGVLRYRPLWCLELFCELLPRAQHR